MKKISILGSTGSIGTQTLDVARQNKDIEIIGLSGNENVDLMFNQIIEFKPNIACMYDEESATILKNKLKDINNHTPIVSGIKGLVKVATFSGTELLITSVVGMIGLIPTIEAIKNKINIALANKETLVTAGNIIMDLAKENGVSILPVDSEHSAIFQCMQGEENHSIKKIILTASGGAFWDITKEEIVNKKAVDALKHPNWVMGNKITIDSATLMNKGLEVIEASYLFDKTNEDIEVLIHRQSIVHSMVEFSDNNLKAQIGVTDMKGPISYALFYPKRNMAYIDNLNLIGKNLTFEEPDNDRFPCLELARNALISGGTSLVVLNSANEVAVNYYLKNMIKFYDINKIIEKTINFHNYSPNPSLDEIIEIDKKARVFVNDFVRRM